MTAPLDAAIIGSGAVGLAVAARLARPDLNIALLERHRRHGLETSSRNSEVVHAGFYYPTGSLKAQLCVEGRRAVYALANKYSIFAKPIGKLVVAGDHSEVPKLEKLFAQGIANGVEGLEMIDAAEVQRRSNGAAKAVAALWSPETGIMDSEELMRLYLGLAQDNGAMIVFDSTVERVEKIAQGYRLWTRGGESVEARCIINAAGLSSDLVATMAGIDIDAAGYRLHWFKGEYFSLTRSLDCRCLVYPLPGPHGLGIHLTLDSQGRQRLGPNSFPVDQLDYSVDASRAADFFAAAMRYLPHLKFEDLSPGTAGIRPKLSNDGSFRDFVIAEESSKGLPGWINLIGIESPGLTASPAIADRIAQLLDWPAPAR